MSENENPRFSRNLEISANVGEPLRPRRTLPEETAGSMSPEEKQMYFRVEGRKILEMLACELERPEPDSASVILISDLHQSWRALWCGDDSFPVGPFSEMFDLAFSILSSHAVIGRVPDAEEKLLLEELKDYMARLVAGSSGLSCLDSCRRLIEKAARLAGRLEEDSLAFAGKASVQKKSEDRDSENIRIHRHPASRTDISNSVDEWFNQVTRLMVQPRSSEIEKPGKDKFTSAETLNQNSLPSFRPLDFVEKELDNSRIVFRQDEKSTGNMGEKSTDEPSSKHNRAIISPEEVQQERKAVPEKNAFPETPHNTPPSVRMNRKSGPLPEIGKEKSEPGKTVQTKQVQSEVKPGCTVESIAGGVFNSPPPEVLAYFRDLSTVTLEVLHHNLAGIVESPGRRGARLVVSYLEQLRGVAVDFGLEGRLSAMEEVGKALERLAATRSERERETLLRRVGEFVHQVRENFC